MITPVDFSHVKITDSFWDPRLRSHATTTLAVCIDQIENQTGRIRNFENAAKREGEHSGIFFDDSDVYKALEGIAYTLAVNGDEQPSPVMENGYAVIVREWNTGDIITLAMDMLVEVVAADPRVKEDLGKRAIQRGPLVYCVEEIDNKDSFDKASISPKTIFQSEFHPSLLNGVTVIHAKEDNKEITLIPYYAWDNRNAGKMNVWIDYRE
jgi:DUF1680 family protein